MEVEAGTYDTVRGHGARFVTLPGHETAVIEVFVERNELYQVVEKVNLFGEIAVSGNPRQ